MFYSYNKNHPHSGLNYKTPLEYRLEFELSKTIIHLNQRNSTIIKVTTNLQYGSDASQMGDLYLPTTENPPVVCLLHGGFWRMPYGREPLAPAAEYLASCGYAVWNIEYRRLGTQGAGWPGTFEDVASGIDHLAVLSDQGVKIDLQRVATVGHSAGGHLAFWVAGRRHNQPGIKNCRVKIKAACGLGALIDLIQAYELGLGNGAVAKLLGGSPQSIPEIYSLASPMENIPFTIPQLLIQGRNDDVVPETIAQAYAKKARLAGDLVELVELPHADHFDYLDLHKGAWQKIEAWLYHYLNLR